MGKPGLTTWRPCGGWKGSLWAQGLAAGVRGLCLHTGPGLGCRTPRTRASPGQGCVQT